VLPAESSWTEPTLAAVPGPPRPRLVAALSGVTAAVFGAGLATAAIQLQGAPTATTVLVTAPSPTTTTTSVALTQLSALPGPSQTRVTGRVTLVTATDAVGAALPLPLTVTVPNRGQGEMTIANVRSGGAQVTVVWGGGQPLPLSGTGGFDLGPARMEADAAGITWHLDLGQRVLLPGHYLAGAPVAIGGGGLAQPEDTATFDAGPGSGFITNGDARVHLPPGPLHLTGPGTLHLSGVLTMQTASGAQTVKVIEFGRGPFDVRLQPSPGGGYTVTALLQGPLTAT